ncbi:MAG TPA: hypothetical protein VLG38_02495 [Gammaproteobacteria bacterium]|nr:hypothetical protein [Gammaproteobacteria bacterium]
MATGSVLVFGSASTLLWWQQGPKSNQPHSNHIKILQRILWGLLAAGVATLIINNIRNIISYLG